MHFCAKRGKNAAIPNPWCSSQAALSGPEKPPACGESVGRFFDVGDFPPAAVAQVRVRELVGDDVMGEGLGTAGKARPKDDTAAAVPDRARTGHPQRPAAARFVVFERDAKSGIVEKITLHFVRECHQNCQHAASQGLEIRKGFEVGGENSWRSFRTDLASRRPSLQPLELEPSKSSRHDFSIIGNRFDRLNFLR